MNLIRKNLIYISITFIFFSCKKYEEGPLLSLRSEEARLINNWEVEKYLENNIEQKKSINAVGSISFKKDKTYRFDYMANRYAGWGSWQFKNNKEEVLLGDFSPVLTVLKLKERELWFYYIENDIKYEYHLKRKSEFL